MYVGVRYGVAEVDEGVTQLAQLAQEDLATKAHDSNRCSEDVQRDRRDTSDRRSLLPGPSADN